MTPLQPCPVFISYATKDRSVAEAICAAIEAIPLRCWMAPRDVPGGADWPVAIIEAIDHCRVMVVVLSSSANESEMVPNEVVHAGSNGRIMIIPFRIEPVAPTSAMQFFLGRRHWLDAFDPPLAKRLQELQERIRRLLASPEPVALRPLPESSGSHVLESVQGRVNAARPEETAEFIALTREMLERHGLDGKANSDVACVLWELLANAAEHGCGRDPAKSIEAECDLFRTHVRVRVADPGPGFSADEVSRDLVERYDVSQTRGRGLIIVRFMCERVEFSEDGRQVAAIINLRPGDGREPESAPWRTAQIVGDVVVLMVPRDPGLATNELEREIDMMLDMSRRKFAIDWQLAEVSPSNLMTALFLRNLRKVHDAGGRVVMFNVNSRLYELLKRLGFTTLFPVRFSLQDALAFLREDESAGG